MAELGKKIIDKLHQISRLDNKHRHTLNDGLCENEKRVYNQAIRHNIYLKDLDLIYERFPSEPDGIRKYRNKNKRQFTKEIMRKVMEKVIEILTHLQIQVNSSSDEFNNWLKSNPFKINGNGYDFNTWSIFYLIHKSLIDPNAILVPYPTLISTQKAFDIQNRFVAYNKRYIDPEGEFIAILENGQFKTFLVADKQDWYRVILKDSAIVEPLANHATGELPYTMVMGIRTWDEKEQHEYQESIICSTYEYCDEALVAHSTEQAVRLKMVPILARPVMSCLDCGGSGKTKEEGLLGEPCKTCKGSGHMVKPGDFSEFVYPKQEWIEGQMGKTPAAGYVNPETSVGEYHKKTWKEYMADAKKSIGIDALIDQQESGEAMKHRVATMEAFLQFMIASHYQFVLRKYLQLVFKLLEWDNHKAWENPPSIKTPKRVEIKTPEILKENYNTALPFEKIQVAIEYANVKYGDDPVLLRAMVLALENYPGCAYSLDELTDLKSQNAISDVDAARSVRAFLVYKKILMDEKNANKDDNYINALATEELKVLVPDFIPTQNTAA